MLKLKEITITMPKNRKLYNGGDMFKRYGLH